MSQDTIITIASLLGAAIGAARINNARNDNSAAEELRFQATNVHAASMAREEASRAALGLTCDSLDSLRDRCWVAVLVPFALVLGQIRRVEFAASDASCEPRPTATWVLPLEETLRPIDLGPMPAGIGGVGAAMVTGLSVLGGASLFGASGTGRPIRSLHGAARESARDAWLGGGPVAKGGGGRRRGETAPLAAAAGGGLFVAGHLLASQAEENLTVARQEHARACVEANLLDARSEHHDLRRRTVEQYHTAINRLLPTAHAAVEFVRGLVASQGVDYSTYSREAQAQLHITVETIRALKALLSVRLWTDDGVESHEARVFLDAATRRLSGPVWP